MSILTYVFLLMFIYHNPELIYVGDIMSTCRAGTSVVYAGIPNRALYP